jgi:vacuolar-type H+-ATPase subunit I/STV1
MDEQRQTLISESKLENEQQRRARENVKQKQAAEAEKLRNEIAILKEVVQENNKKIEQQRKSDMLELKRIEREAKRGHVSRLKIIEERLENDWSENYRQDLVGDLNIKFDVRNKRNQQ